MCLQRSTTESYLAFAIHPIMADADSAAAILSGLSAAYDAVVSHDGSGSALSHMTLQPSTFAGWEERQQASDAWQMHRSFWASKLKGASRTLDLPRSVARSRNASGAVWSIPIQFPRDVWQQAHKVAANEETQPVAVLLAALQVRLAP